MQVSPKIALTLITAAAAFAQEFEVASVRPSGDLPQSAVNIGLHIDGAQVRCAYLSLKDYIGIAYRVKIYQISGPDWIASQRYDIVAKLPSGSTTTQLPEMFQALLAERFQIKMHREKKDFPVYVLEIGKGGSKLKETPSDPKEKEATPGGGVFVGGGGSSNGVNINLGNGSYFTFGNNRFEAKKMSMALLAGSLERFTDRPIVDMTDLKWNYDFALDVTAEDYQAMLIRSAIAAGVTLPPQAMRALDNGSLGSLFDSLQKVGLKLDPRKAPLDVIVIDQALKTPTEN